MGRMNAKRKSTTIGIGSAMRYAPGFHSGSGTLRMKFS